MSKKYKKTKSVAEQCDLLIVVGSGLRVWPACAFPVIAKQSGAKVVFVNKTPTNLDSIADLIFREPAEKILPEIVAVGKAARQARLQCSAPPLSQAYVEMESRQTSSKKMCTADVRTPKRKRKSVVPVPAVEKFFKCPLTRQRSAKLRSLLEAEPVDLAQRYTHKDLQNIWSAHNISVEYPYLQAKSIVIGQLQAFARDTLRSSRAHYKRAKC